MLDLSKVKYRLDRSDFDKIFEQLRKELAPGGISETLATRLDKYIDRLEEFCTLEWNEGARPIYRARRNISSQLSELTDEEIFEQFTRLTTDKMGPPPAKITPPGRANVCGVPRFYLANTALTAISEIRPNVGEYVTVGSFMVREGSKLKLFDLTGSCRLPDLEFDSKPSFIADRFFDAIGLLPDLSRAFSSPVHPKDDEQTAYLAYSHFVKRILDRGYDGIKYKSPVSEDGVNFTFSNANHFRCATTELYYIKGVSALAEPINFSHEELQSIKKDRLAVARLHKPM